MKTGRPVKNPEARQRARAILASLNPDVVTEIHREIVAETRRAKMDRKAAARKADNQ